MKYRSGANFRQALEDRLRTRSLETGAPLVRLRKMVVFDRLLARLLTDQPHAWVLKGGLALQLRLGKQARTTKDIDVLLIAPFSEAGDVHQALVRAALLDLGDWFQFEVQQPDRETPVERLGGVRFQVWGLLDGRRFETFRIDVGWSDQLVEPADTLTTQAALEFAGIEPVAIPCYPLAQRVAEKVHAYTRPRASGAGSRVKDLVDFLLIAELRQMDGRTLRLALESTFETRQTHPLPARFPDPPSSWAAPFRRLTTETGLSYRTLSTAGEAARQFVDPVLRREPAGQWNPEGWAWLPE